MKQVPNEKHWIQIYLNKTALALFKSFYLKGNFVKIFFYIVKKDNSDIERRIPESLERIIVLPDSW